MKEQLLQAWTTHHQKNELLLRHLTEAALALSLSVRGRTIGQQLAHLHAVRLNWVEAVAKNLSDKTLVLQKDAALSLPILREALSASASKITAIIDQSWEKGGKLPSFKAGLIPFVSYLISHESHHRGNILLTLKQSGEKIPNELKWGLWEW